MRLTIERTGRTETINGLPCQLWKGRTPGGARCLVFVLSVVVDPAAGPGDVGADGAVAIDSTDHVGDCRGRPYRVWRGPNCFLFVPHIAVADDQDAAEFDAELRAMPKPADWPPPVAVLPQINGGVCPHKDTK